MSGAPLCMHLMHAELFDNSNYSYRFLPSSEESFVSVTVCETWVCVFLCIWFPFVAALRLCPWGWVAERA